MITYRFVTKETWEKSVWTFVVTNYKSGAGILSFTDHGQLLGCNIKNTFANPVVVLIITTLA
jgi:hypothetical protein